MIVDGGAFIGHDLATGHDYPVERLLADYDRHGVSCGVVGSLRAIYQDLKAGNEELAEAARKHPERILPLGVLHPYYYGQSYESLIAWLADDLGFKAIGLFSAPAYYSIDWASPVVKKIGALAQAKGLALHAGVKTERELWELAESWGSLKAPVFVRWMAGHHYRSIVSELEIAARCPNFIFDAGNVTSVTVFGHLVARLGSSRVFLASNAPHHIFTNSLCVLGEMRLDERQRADVSGANVLSAMGVKAQAKNAQNPYYSSTSWKELVALPKVDVHWHADHWNQGEALAFGKKEQVAVFDRFNYEKVIQFSILGLNYDIVVGNALSAETCEWDPRVHALIVVNPHQIERSLAEIEKYSAHPRFVGLKTIQDAYGMGLDDARFKPMLELAAEKGLPVLGHLGGIANAAKANPGVNFIAAHSNYERARHLAGIPNVFFDFATSHSNRAENRLADFIRHVGVSQVCFGSDSLLMSPAWSLAKLWDAGVERADLERILRANAYRVFPKLLRTAQ